jgi:hypothetical protein
VFVPYLFTVTFYFSKIHFGFLVHLHHCALYCGSARYAQKSSLTRFLSTLQKGFLLPRIPLGRCNKQKQTAVSFYDNYNLQTLKPAKAVFKCTFTTALSLVDQRGMLKNLRSLDF